MKERAPREFQPIICQHCQEQFIPTSSSQKYHSDCKTEVKRTRRRERYHTDPDFKERLIRSNRRSGKKAHDELSTRKLVDLLEVATRWMGHFTTDPYPVFPVEEGIVMISPEGLLLKTEESESPIPPHDAVKNYTYRRIKEAIEKILVSDLKK